MQCPFSQILSLAGQCVLIRRRRAQVDRVRATHTECAGFGLWWILLSTLLCKMDIMKAPPHGDL